MFDTFLEWKERWKIWHCLFCFLFFFDCFYLFCCSAGIEPTGNRVLRPAVFTVDTFSAGQGQVTVYLDHPDGTREEVRCPPTCCDFISLFHIWWIMVSNCLDCLENKFLSKTCVCVFVYQLKPELNEGKKTYSVTYIPQVMGTHKVNFFNQMHTTINGLLPCSSFHQVWCKSVQWCVILLKQ